MRQMPKRAEMRKVTVQGGGLRLDQFLAMQDGVKSRTIAKRLIEDGAVTVGGRATLKVSLALEPGTEVTYTLPAAPSVPDDTGPATPLPVVYEDDACMVISKPAGIAVHPGTGMDTDTETILRALKPLFKERKLPFSESEVLVHRLDKETTGCLLIAKTPAAHLKLQKQFADRSVEKIYLTLVSGTPNPKAATIDAPIGRHASMRTTMSVYQATASRDARTSYRTLGSGEGVALLSCELHTGRTHQIRVHLHSIGHPVLGDPTYNNGTSIAVAEGHGIDFLCLHAWKLSFVSSSKKNISVTCPLPERFMHTLGALGIAIP